MSSGAYMFMKNGKLHNTDGPALVNQSAYCSSGVTYYIEGYPLPFKEWIAYSTLDQEALAHLILTHEEL
jgi:hypothetical protein